MAFLDAKSPYRGWPDDEKDRMWQDMYSSEYKPRPEVQTGKQVADNTLEGMAIRIAEDSARKLINSTEHAPISGFEKEYVVGLDVFHQLHCLVSRLLLSDDIRLRMQNQLRKNIYPKRYNSSIIREDGSIDFLAWSHLGKLLYRSKIDLQEAYIIERLDHCIETIRESLTCSADVSAIPYRWNPRTKIAEPDIRSIHMCRNFTKIRDWAFDRFLPMTSKRMHVENGTVVDYSGVGRHPEEVVAQELANPDNWNKTTQDL